MLLLGRAGLSSETAVDGAMVLRRPQHHITPNTHNNSTAKEFGFMEAGGTSAESVPKFGWLARQEALVNIEQEAFYNSTMEKLA